jgi:hypothetical protein
VKTAANPERHEGELYLAVEDIDHSRKAAPSMWCTKLLIMRGTQYECPAQGRGFRLRGT